MKKLIIIGIVLAACAGFAMPCAAEQLSDEYIRNSGIYESAAQLDKETKQIIEQLGIDEITAQNVYALDFSSVLKSVLASFKTAFSDNIKAILMVLGIVITAALTDASTDKLTEKNQSFFGVIATLVIALSVAVPLSKMLSLASVTVKSASVFTISAVPVMCVVTAAQGKTISASLCSAGAVGIAQVLSSVFSEFFMPLCYILPALGMCAAADTSLKTERIISLMRKYIFVALSACSVLYFTVLSLRTSIACAVDESTVKTIKFASSNFVPVIGSAISDSAVAVAASLAVCKNTIGVFGIVCLAAVFLPLLSQIFVWLIGLELGAVMAETFGILSVEKLLKSLKDTLRLLLVIIVFCAVLFLIHFGVLLGLRGAV
ncbi:MAG: hypothetical protein IKE65_00220 [Clostridia bacterium]|nr:hypothetical protein [Clostridia bacterium]